MFKGCYLKIIYEDTIRIRNVTDELDSHSTRFLEGSLYQTIPENRLRRKDVIDFFGFLVFGMYIYICMYIYIYVHICIYRYRILRKELYKK